MHIIENLVASLNSLTTVMKWLVLVALTHCVLDLCSLQIGFLVIKEMLAFYEPECISHV